MTRQFHPVANLFPLMVGEEYAQLKVDIATNGQREPIWLHPADGSIIDGRNRYRVCTELDIPPRYCIWDGQGSLVCFVLSLNLHRRHLTSSQRAAIAVDILPMLEEEAKERQQLHGNTAPGRQSTLPQKFAEVNGGEAREQAAALLGTNRQYVSDIKVIKSAAPELVEDLRNGELTVPEAKMLSKLKLEQRSTARGWLVAGQAKDVTDAIRQIHQQERRQAAQQLVMAPQKIYNVIYADPPWEYRNTGVHGAASHHYHTMSLADLRMLPNTLGLNIADNAVLFLWITNPLIAEAFDVVESWGFTYKTNMVWTKTDLVKPGAGFYIRGRHELLFICTRGSFTPLNPNVSPPIGSVVVEPVREHSRKPDRFYEIIESLYPGCRYLELFARRSRPGWDAWGDEIDA
jgi:N6-adenosine-specific RNA methylase IME4